MMTIAVISDDCVTYYKSVRHACKELGVQMSYINHKMDAYKLCEAGHWSRLMQILSNRGITKSLYNGWASNEK